MKESDEMAIIITMLMAWVPETYFAATNLIQAFAWGALAIFMTVATICLVHEQHKKSASRWHD